MPGLYDISSNVANVAVSNTPGLYIGSGASSILNNAQQLLALLSNQGNVNFALASGNTTVQGFFVGNIPATYSNANVAAYLLTNTGNIAAGYFIGNGSKLTNLPVQAGTYTNANVAAFLPTYDGNIGQPAQRPSYVYSSFFVGDGSQLTNLPNTSTYGNANVAVFLPTNTSNVAATYFLGDGSQLTNLPIPGVYGNANVAAYLLTSTGNISAGYFLGDGSKLTNLPSTYGNSNVAAYLPTYTGTLDNSSTVVTLFANAASQALDITTLYNAIAIANNNQIAANITISNLDANVGAFETYANATFGTSNYGNANVAAYLPTYSGTLDNSSTIVNLVANAATQATAINTINANLGVATNNITTLFSNAATQATAINTIDANLGVATNNITTLFSNAATQQTQIDTLNANVGTLFLGNASTNANLGAFQTYANTTFGTSSYSNVQVAAFLPTYTGNIGNLAITTGKRWIYSGNVEMVANNTTPTGGIINLIATKNGAFGGNININGGQVEIGYGLNAGDKITMQGPTDFNGKGLTGNVFAFAQGNVIIQNNNTSGGNKSDYGGYLWVNNNISAAGSITSATTMNTSDINVTSRATAGNITTTNGLFWANGQNVLSSIPGTYSNSNVAAYLVTSTSILTNSNNSVVRLQNTANTAYVQVGNFGLDTVTVQSGNVSIAGYTTYPINIDNGFGNVEYSATWHNFRQSAGATNNNASLKVFGNVQATGNVSGSYFIGDGSGLTNVSAAPWGDYQGSGFQSIQADSALLTFNSLGAIASGNLTGGLGSIVGTLNDPNWADGPYAFMSAQASNYFDGSANQASIIVPRSGVSANTSVVNGADWSTTWGNVLILPQGATAPEIYEFSNVGIRFPDGTIQSTAGGSSTYGNTQVAAYLLTSTGNIAGNSVSLTFNSSANRFVSTTGYFWANGTAYSTGGGSTYGNVEMQANLAANSTQTTAWSIPFGGNAARPSVPFAGMIRYNTDYGLPEWYSNVAAAWYAFSNPVTPIAPVGISMWYLNVAGGGAGGSRIGAGGGAGGYLTGNANITAGTTYTITVGAGGAAVSSTPGTLGNDGGNTVISGTGLTTITAVGGGGGGAYIGTSGTAGRNGGSGGGGSYSGNGGVNTPGSGTLGQGGQGGAGSATNVSGGGGGGAGSVGEAAQASRGGNGGPGSYNLITGANVAYAGGGGGSQVATGGTGGVGGGGVGGTGNGNGTAGTNYLGGGGGGARNDSDTSNVFSGKGGDGVCIIRVANVNYSGSYTGSNVAISYAGGDTILKFSASGTYVG